MYISLTDLFKIGIGPSSSHTVGPMRAARRFLMELPDGMLSQIARVRVELFGSLAHTGKGHGTDVAIQLGFCGELPDEVDTASIPARVATIAREHSISLLGQQPVRFQPLLDIRYNLKDLLPLHSNAMTFRAYSDNAAEPVAERTLYSIGGGFIVDEDEAFVGSPRGGEATVPYPFASMAELLLHGKRERLPLMDLLRANEHALRGTAATTSFLDRVIDTFFTCIDRGIVTRGELPGGLNVKRRAPDIHHQLTVERGQRRIAPHKVLDWVSVYAIAVNEENAAGGRVVTAPTNGAAGVVPAVLRYARDFCDVEPEGLHDFLLVASAVGALCKMNASISGAEVGCQGEVGSAAAMAAAGLAAAFGASNEQIENAAEIALEHHLGMTCDPIGGLVQIPCIERNAMGAVKAISATSLAMRGDGTHRISLDQAIDTMRRTGADMQAKYKETSQGGLALAQVEC
ncbi:MAG TPA: L-serine ammonia-lyase [Casimicrobium huifangae]|jgi:L-serine dehydratase|uniref:L-serine ammonia-lyase n=1 Tax=Casimicrobium huifangae TaxID=2591109 RepID=UPI0012EB3A23|nr:L-serine ammonia-lyase [Casimicrobium huifangae]HQA33361.1 L-serine ammonia-lyase [Casimicrobium huifangae]HQD64904.1 L-serine ammonia-lyase [Casimicrobium huifangae]